jgi:hypothetical protein
MENTISKKLIVLGIIIFSLAVANNAHAMTYAFSNSPVTRFYSNSAAEYAGQGYTQYSYYQQSGVGYNQPQMMPINNPYVQYSYYQQSGYNGSNNSNTKQPTTVVNNYYQGAPATTKTTNVSDTDTKNTSNTDGTNNGSNLGASAYGNGITALSFRGSGGFFPSSVWQWLLVIVLILIIIIIGRILTKKPTVEAQEAHIAHAH